MKHELPELPYSYDALEPHIDAQTMEIHHAKHHQGYIDKLNAVLEKYPDLQDRKLEDLLKNLESLQMDNKDKAAFKNNGGGHVNHSLFWEIMGAEKAIDEALAQEISKEFGSMEKFKELFSNVATTQFGSGWAWLIRDESEVLQVYSTANQDSPHTQGHTPIICLDVWEHAYYLKYQNKRPEYIENWWNVLKVL